MEMEMLADALNSEPWQPLKHEILRIYQQTPGLKDQWDVRQSTDAAKLWLMFNNRQALCMEQGWKLHIAAYPSSALAVLQRVLAVLLKATSSFKVVISLQALSALNQGRYGWSQIGKFITIYPPGPQEALRLAMLLDERTRSLSGPRIPSDRPLRPGSLVHYRYGAFGNTTLIQERDGLISPAIRTPTNELIPDRRTTHYEVPDWCVDPFVHAGISSKPPRMKRIVEKRYLLAGIITASPRHTLYLAGDLQQARSCALKGPGFVWEQSNGDEHINQSLLHEADILRTLADVAQIPELYDCLEQDGSVFLVLEDIKGETLYDYMKLARNQSMQIPIRQTIDWGKQIATILGAIHERGFVYADLKPSNIIIDSNRHLHLIDFELTDRQGSRGRGEYGTRGYISPQRQRGLPLSIADDIYSFGALLYFIVTGADPAEAPDVAALLAREPAWFSPAGALLQPLIARCLNEHPDERYTSMQEIVQALETLEAGWHESSFSLEGARENACEIPSNETATRALLSQELLRTLYTHARHEPGQEGLFWSSAHPVTYGLVARDINTGNAGVLLAFAELVAAHTEMAFQPFLARAARWMQRAPFIYGQPLPGLYIGEAGVGAALLRAGQLLRDDALINAAIERGRLVASLPYASPDLFHGTAGRLRFHLCLWDETGEQEHLRHAIACGEHLLATASHNENGEVFWRLPEGYRGLSGQIYLGYAHGAAGIADALLDLFEVTGDERSLSVLRGVAQWLRRQAVTAGDDESALNWPKREGEPATAPFWCHGGTGIGQFFLHAAQHDFFPEAGELAARAARSVARSTRWANPTQCHGLAGNIEFLLDMYQATGQDMYREQAFSLARCLAAFALEQEESRVFPSEVPTVFTPDYMVGYSGIAVCILRLNEPAHRPRQLCRRGFRYNPSAREYSAR
jgi:serine/threonine protein kinase